MSSRLALIALIALGSSSLAVAPADAAGAIVSTPQMGTYIYMTHRPSPGFAANLALSDCMGRFGGGCRVLSAYGSGCLAIAQAHDGSHHSGWAVKGSVGQAEAYALGQCSKYGMPCALDIVRCE